MTAQHAIERCLQALNAIDAMYMVVGSLSSNYHGVPRSTKDADIVIDVAGDEIVRLRDQLKGIVRLDPQTGFETVQGTTKHTFLAEDSAFEIEVFELSQDKFAQERFGRRLSVQIGGIDAFIPTAEDVVVQKLRWNRPKDIGDVRDVIDVQRDRLDWKYILHWCDQHGSRDVLDVVCDELGIDPTS